MPTNVHLYPSDMTHESRMLRETHEVVEGGIVDTVLMVGTHRAGLARSEPVDDNRRIHRLRTLVPWGRKGKLAKMLAHLEWTVRVVAFCLTKRVDIVTCHGLTVLPIGVFLRRFKGSCLIYSPHELETETASPPIPRPVAKRLERRLVPRADAVIVVGQRIADWYQDQYGLDEVQVVRNIPTPKPLPEVQPTILKDKLAIPDDELVFLYQGLFTNGRSIELLLSAFAEVALDRHLVLLGYGGMTEFVEQAAAAHPNIHYLPAVPPDVLADYTAGADVGLSLIENVSLSYYYSLPNKIFEYIHAGVPVLASDFPEMSDLLSRFQCGWLTDVDVGAVTTLVGRLSRDEIQASARNAVAARQALNWTEDRRQLIDGYRQGLRNRR